MLDEIEIGGVVRDLRHLREFTVPVSGKGMNGRDLRVLISIGTHAISQSADLANHDMIDENGKPRLFCEDRYAFSLGLPELAKRMVMQNYFCWKSRDKNRSINYAVIDIAPGRVRELADGDHQVVYFYFYPADGVDADVKLIITSCHVRHMVFKTVNRRYNIVPQLRKCLYDRVRVP